MKTYFIHCTECGEYPVPEHIFKRVKKQEKP